MSVKVYSNLEKKDYVIEKFYANASLSFTLVSGSGGVEVTSPTDLAGAVMIETATNDENTETLNVYSEVNQYNLYRSIKHLFYTDRVWYDASTRLSTASLTPIPDDFYVVSVARNYYGDRIKPGSFELSINSVSEVVNDDKYGNLFVSESGTGSYVGNIFYDDGIAVVKHDIAMGAGDVSGSGIKIVNGDSIYVDIETDAQIVQHEITVKLDEYEFNHSWNNPSMRVNQTITGSATSSFDEVNVPKNSDGTYSLYQLMAARVIKPYITTIGLYDDSYNLIAVGKVSTPIQRTFDTKQIFIVRFQQTDY